MLRLRPSLPLVEWLHGREAFQNVTCGLPGGEMTYNTCPDCGDTWTDRVPTAGVVHRTTRCAACRRQPPPEPK
jgi:hypothetical protein